MNSSWVANGPKDRPSLYSCSLLASLASMILRCAGVYSSSALGNWERSITSLGVMTILPRENAASTRSPSAMPAKERKRVGKVIWPLRWILTRVEVGERLNDQKSDFLTY